ALGDVERLALLTGLGLTALEVQRDVPPPLPAVRLSHLALIPACLTHPIGREGHDRVVSHAGHDSVTLTAKHLHTDLTHLRVSHEAAIAGKHRTALGAHVHVGKVI